MFYRESEIFYFSFFLKYNYSFTLSLWKWTGNYIQKYLGERVLLVGFKSLKPESFLEFYILLPTSIECDAM